MKIDLTSADLATREAESRPLRFSKIDLIEYQRPAQGGKVAAGGGTLTIFIAPKGAPILAKIRETVAAGNEEADYNLGTEIYQPFGARKEMSYPDAVDAMVAQPVFADVRYGGKTLATNLFVPSNLPAAVLPLPYSGGPLAPDAFVLVEHYRENEDAQLEAVAVAYAPPLTPAETAALRNVPLEDSEIHLGLCDYVTGAGRAAFVATLAATAAAAMLLGVRKTNMMIFSGAVPIADATIVGGQIVAVVGGPQIVAVNAAAAAGVGGPQVDRGTADPGAQDLSPSATARRLISARRAFLSE